LIPGREGDVDYFIRSNLRSGSVFVDVGANVGYYTLLASKLVGAQGRVYAVEAVPSTASILKANVKLNECRNVRVYNVAAWSSKGQIVLSVPWSMYGFASVAKGSGETLMVNATTLDDILKEEGFVDLIKIDVEGAEYEVLVGAKEVLSRVGCLVVELSRNVREVLKLLTRYGFRVRKAKLTAYIIACRGW